MLQAGLLFQYRFRHGPRARRQRIRTAGSGRHPRRRAGAVQGLGSGGGATATTSRATGGTDSTSFNNAGLPGIGLQQDPIEYQSFTWHTNLDTYERIVPEDVKQAATEIASLVWTVSQSRSDDSASFRKTRCRPRRPAAGAETAAVSISIRRSGVCGLVPLISKVSLLLGPNGRGECKPGEDSICTSSSRTKLVKQWKVSWPEHNAHYPAWSERYG